MGLAPVTFNGAASGTAGTTTDFTSFLTVGSEANRVMTIYLEQDDTGTDDLTSVTWDQGGSNQAMFLVPNTKDNSNGFYTYMYYVIAPTTVTNGTLRVVSSSSVRWRVSGGYYSGAKQTASVIDSSTFNNGASGTSFSSSTNVVGNGCWLVMGSFINNGIGTDTAGSGTILRHLASAGQSFATWWDSNGTVSSGAQSLNISWTGSNFVKTSIASIAPSGNTFTETLTEALSIADTLVRLTTKNLTESVSISDTLNKVISRVYSEVVTLSDLFGRGFTIVLNETIALSDALVKYMDDIITSLWVKVNKPQQ